MLWDSTWIFPFSPLDGYSCQGCTSWTGTALSTAELLWTRGLWRRGRKSFVYFKPAETMVCFDKQLLSSHNWGVIFSCSSGTYVSSVMLQGFWYVLIIYWYLPSIFFTAVLNNLDLLSWKKPSLCFLQQGQLCHAHTFLLAMFCQNHLPEHNKWRLTGPWGEHRICRTHSTQNGWLIRFCVWCTKVHQPRAQDTHQYSGIMGDTNLSWKYR